MTVMIIKTVLIFILYMVTFYCFGVLFNKLVKREQPDFTVTMLAGMFLYATIFMVYAIPLKYHKNPLNMTATIWAILMVIMIAGIVYYCRNEIWKPLLSAKEYILSHKLLTGLIGGTTFAQILFVEIFGRWSSSNNQSNYIAYVTTAVFTNQVGTTNPYTGFPETVFEPRLFTQTFLDHSAVISKIFHIHPLMEIRHVYPIIFLIFGNMLIALLGRAFLKDSDIKQWLFYSLYVMALCIASNSYFMSGYYVFFRICEGKNLYSAIMVPLLFYVLWELYEDPRNRIITIFGVICVIGSFHYTGIALFSVPITIVIGLIPALFSKKNWHQVIFNMIVFSIPCVIYAVYYLGVTKGHFSLTI